MIEDLVSVIVPIYNCEKFLLKCIESIINQTYVNIEVILIDDGSTDNSLSICNKLKEMDNRIKLFHNENRGVSFTRNFGIEKSCGEYIMFVDADDYIENNFIELMANCSKKYSAQLVLSNHYIDKGDNLKLVTACNKDNCEKDITFPNSVNLFFENYAFSSACIAMFKKENLVRNDIKFNENMKYGEDALFTFTSYVYSNKTIYSPINGYHYRINENSVTFNTKIDFRIKKCVDNFEFYNNICNLVQLNSTCLNLLIDRTLEIYSDSLNMLIKSMLYNNCFNIKHIKEINDLYKSCFSKYSILNTRLKFSYKLKLFLLKYKMLYIYSLIVKLKVML